MHLIHFVAFKYLENQFPHLRCLNFQFLRRSKTPRDELVITPSLCAVGLKTKQLTEENSDFASRHRHHQSSFITADEMVQPPLRWHWQFPLRTFAVFLQPLPQSVEPHTAHIVLNRKVPHFPFVAGEMMHEMKVYQWLTASKSSRGKKSLSEAWHMASPCNACSAVSSVWLHHFCEILPDWRIYGAHKEQNVSQCLRSISFWNVNKPKICCNSWASDCWLS